MRKKKETAHKIEEACCSQCGKSCGGDVKWWILPTSAGGIDEIGFLCSDICRELYARSRRELRAIDADTPGWVKLSPADIKEGPNHSWAELVVLKEGEEQSCHHCGGHLNNRVLCVVEHRGDSLPDNIYCFSDARDMGLIVWNGELGYEVVPTFRKETEKTTVTPQNNKKDYFPKIIAEKQVQETSGCVSSALYEVIPGETVEGLFKRLGITGERADHFSVCSVKLRLVNSSEKKTAHLGCSSGEQHL